MACIATLERSLFRSPNVTFEILKEGIFQSAKVTNENYLGLRLDIMSIPL